MRRVLFVDDETAILDGMKKALRRHRGEWVVESELSAEAALARLEAGRFDAVVSDVRMPGMDGEAFLRQVQERWPDVVRVVLSGEVRTDVAQRLAQIAHQFVPKPVTAEQLFTLVEDALTSRDLLSSPELRRLVGRLGDLPALPETFSALISEMGQPRPSYQRISTIVGRDPAIAANVLRVVNSAYYGLSRHVSSVEEAVRLLGLKPLEVLVLAAEVYGATGTADLGAHLQGEALCRARASRELLTQAGCEHLIASTETAAVLSEVGLVIVATRDPPTFERIAEERARNRCSWEVAEARLLGTHHGVLGGALLGLWNLPREVCQAVTRHHGPWTEVPPASPASALGLVVVLEQLRSDDPGRVRLRDELEVLRKAFPLVDVDALGEPPLQLEAS